MNKEELLRALAKKDRTFNDLVLECASNRNSTRAMLRELAKEGLIEERPEDWRQGKRKFIHLTNEGNLELLRKENEQINYCFETIEFVINRFENQGFEEFRDYSRKKSPTIHVSGPYGGDIPIYKEDTAQQKIERADALANFKEAFIRLMIVLNTHTGSSDA